MDAVTIDIWGDKDFISPIIFRLKFFVLKSSEFLRTPTICCFISWTLQMSYFISFFFFFLQKILRAPLCACRFLPGASGPGRAQSQKRLMLSRPVTAPAPLSYSLGLSRFLNSSYHGQGGSRVAVVDSVWGSHQVLWRVSLLWAPAQISVSFSSPRNLSLQI